jgi:hypothetical protein
MGELRTVNSTPVNLSNQQQQKDILLLAINVIRNSRITADELLPTPVAQSYWLKITDSSRYKNLQILIYLVRLFSGQGVLKRTNQCTPLIVRFFYVG